MTDQIPKLSPEYVTAYSGDQLINTAIALIPIILVFVSMRFYARYLSKSSWGIDDYLVLCSLVFQIGASALAIVFVKYGGVGHHLDALEETNPKVVPIYFKTLLAVAVYYFSTVGIPKLAILAFYMRIFTTRSYRIAVYIVAAIVILTAIVCDIVSLAECRPFAFNWDRSIPGGKCLDESSFYRLGSLPNIITDVVILVLPIPLVWNLHTSKNMKLGLTLTFMTGSLGLATSIARFASFYKSNAFTDGTWSSVTLMTWTIVEPDVYLIASCLPTYRPLLVKFLSTTRRLRSTGVSGSGRSAGPQQQNQMLVVTEGGKISSAGFKRLGKNDFERGDGDSLEDDIRLVDLTRKNDVEVGIENTTSELGVGPNQIQVRRDYFVRRE